MHPWESEYRNPQFITLGTEPTAAIRDFAKWLRREQKIDMGNFTVLDLGCGNGKNLRYFVEHFARRGIGYDISETAIKHARELAEDMPIIYDIRSIGKPFPLDDASVDIVIDATSSHALDAAERKIFLQESARVLCPGGYMFVRTLAIEGDKNAKNLLAEFPSGEANAYILPGTTMHEHVFSREDLERDFGNDFTILNLQKDSGYQKWGNQNYKRNYWVGYLQRK